MYSAPSVLFCCCFIDIALAHVEPAEPRRVTDWLDIDHIRLMTQSFSAVKGHDITAAIGPAEGAVIHSTAGSVHTQHAVIIWEMDLQLYH